MIIIASTRPRQIDLPVARWFKQRAVAHGGFDVAVADLAARDLPLHVGAAQPA